MGVEVIDGGYYEINDFHVDISDNEDATYTMDMRYLQDLSLYPNPVRDGVIYISLNQANVAYADIYDLTGNLRISARLEPGTNYLNIESLNNGVYMIQIKLTDEITIQKFVIER